MPKPIINNTFKEQNISATELSLKHRDTYKSLELAFREKRPQNYINLMKNLDIEGEKISENKLNEIITQLKNLIPEISLDDSFIGVLGKCQLGADYDVHTLSKKIIFGIDESTHQLGYGRMILKHFKVNENLPEGLEKGRSLAVNPNYAFVEIYNDKLIAVQEDGNVAILKD